MSHLSEDCVENYLLGRSPGQLDFEHDDPELKAVEEHLLVCPGCVERAEVMEATIAVIREALLLPARRRAKPKVFTAGSPMF